MSTPTQGFFESDDNYRERISREADERTIERNTENSPSQGFFESDDDYRSRISEEADESIVERVAGNAPSQGWIESDDHYRDRISLEADEREIEDVSGDSPSQGWFESDDAYRGRVSEEANESVIERATGDAPSQGWFESEDSYRDRIATEADEHRGSDDSSSGCFFTTACTEAAGLADDCLELTVLRQFRDGFLAQQPNGHLLIQEYYQVAPQIVACIQKSPRRLEILNEMWFDVRVAVALVQSGQNNTALECYGKMFAFLKREYLRA